MPSENSAAPPQRTVGQVIEIHSDTCASDHSAIAVSVVSCDSRSIRARAAFSSADSSGTGSGSGPGSGSGSGG